MRRRTYNSPRKFETLETRRMMTGDISYNNGIITINGDGSDNVAHVRFEEDRVYVDLTFLDGDGQPDSDEYDRSIPDNLRIIFNGFAGNDQLTVDVQDLDSDVSLDNVVLEFHGGENNDQLFNEVSGGVRVEAWGDSGNDTLEGSGYDDLFDGGTGHNYLHGRGGNDRYVFTTSTTNPARIDEIFEASNVDRDTLDFSNYQAPDNYFKVDLTQHDYVPGTNDWALAVNRFDVMAWLHNDEAIEDVIGTAWEDEFIGNSRNNFFSGLGGNDKFRSSGGNDTYDGGAGNDHYYFAGASQGTDEIIEAASADKDILDFNLMSTGINIDLTKVGTNYALNSTDLRLKLSNNTAIETVIGTFYRDTITGNTRDNDLRGLTGNDTLSGGGGNDDLGGGGGDDTLIGGEGNDILDGNSGNDTYFFGGTNLGIDRIVEAASADIDTLDFSGMKQGLSVNLRTIGPHYAVDSANLKLLLANDTAIENVIGTNYDDTIIGNARNNELSGGRGNDFISGSSGADILRGGDGADEFTTDALDEVYGGAGLDRFDLVYEFEFRPNPRPERYKDWGFV